MSLAKWPGGAPICKNPRDSIIWNMVWILVPFAHFPFASKLTLMDVCNYSKLEFASNLFGQVRLVLFVYIYHVYLLCDDFRLYM